MPDRLDGWNQYTASLNDAHGASLSQLSEVLKGSTIRSLEPQLARSPEDGEVLRINLNNGDMLLVCAVPGSDLEIAGARARIQVLLATRKGTRLRA